MTPLSLALPLVLVLYLSKFKVDDRHGSMLIYLNVFVCVYFFFLFFLGGRGKFSIIATEMRNLLRSFFPLLLKHLNYSFWEKVKEMSSCVPKTF